MKRGHMILTWVPFGDQGKSKPVRHDTGGPFTVKAKDTATEIHWEITVFSGDVTCTPFKLTGERDYGVIGGFRLYTPSNIVNPTPGAPKTDVDRRPIPVANVAGSRMRLERGHAVVVECGAGNLHVSWDYPEYPHPSVES